MNEPLAQYNTTVVNYDYKAKNKDIAKTNCNNQHAVATYTESNGSTVNSEDCDIQ